MTGHKYPGADLSIRSGIRLLQAVLRPGENAGPAVAIDHVIAEPGQRNKSADTSCVVIDHIAMMNVGSCVFAKDTFETVPHSEVRHFCARSTHDGWTSTTTINDGCQRILALEDNTHDKGDVFIVNTAFDKDCIPGIRISESISNLREIARHIDIPGHGGSRKKHRPGRN